jgi:hypothetical protein
MYVRNLDLIGPGPALAMPVCAVRRLGAFPDEDRKGRAIGTAAILSMSHSERCPFISQQWYGPDSRSLATALCRLRWLRRRAGSSNWLSRVLPYDLPNELSSPQVSDMGVLTTK